MDFSLLTGAIDLATVVTSILAVAAIKVLPTAAKYGANKVLGMIGR